MLTLSGPVATTRNRTVPVDASVRTIRCFLSPLCWPARGCIDPSVPTSLSGASRDHGAFCVKDLKQSSQATQQRDAWAQWRRASEAPCLIYSVGIGWTGVELEWEHALHAATGCEVHAFDPTPGLAGPVAERSARVSGVHFHPLGLRDGFAARRSGGRSSAWHRTSTQYEAIDPAQLLSFRELQQRLGHTGRAQHRIVDVLGWGHAACRSDGMYG